MNRNGIIILLVLFGMILMPLNIFSKEAEKPLKLNECIEKAYLNNPLMRSAFYEWKASVEKITQAGALSDPQFTYSDFIRNIETRIGPIKQNISLMQKFPWFGKLGLRKKSAFFASESKRNAYEAEKLNTYYNVSTAFLDYYYLSKSIEVMRKHIELFDSFENVARTLYSVSSLRASVLVQIHVEQGKLEDRLKTLEGFREPLSDRLKAEIGTQDRGILPWPKLEEKSVLNIPKAELMKLLDKNNPELAKISNMKEKAESDHRLARLDHYPDIGIGIQWGVNGRSSMPNVTDSGKDSVALMLSFNLPIQKKRLKAHEDEIGFIKKSLESKEENKRNMLFSGLSMAIYNYDDSKRRMDFYKKDLIPKAQQAFELSLKDFTSENASFADMIVSERALLQFRLDYEKALVDMSKNEAMISKMSGYLIKEGGNQE